MFNIEKAKWIYSDEVYAALERAAALCVKNTNGDIGDLVDRIKGDGLVVPITESFDCVAVDSDGFLITVEVYPAIAAVLKKDYRGGGIPAVEVVAHDQVQVSALNELARVREFINSNI